MHDGGCEQCHQSLAPYLRLVSDLANPALLLLLLLLGRSLLMFQAMSRLFKAGEDEGSSRSPHWNKTHPNPSRKPQEGTPTHADSIEDVSLSYQEIKASWCERPDLSVHNVVDVVFPLAVLIRVMPLGGVVLLLASRNSYIAWCRASVSEAVRDIGWRCGTEAWHPYTCSTGQTQGREFCRSLSLPEGRLRSLLISRRERVFL
ncbi:hypothetical protein O3P69_004093 [Scylla paramamosain]|uniref:Uncharacterized protein n=1 Tax=Scylla paramamosain TaxID=85552 RepID=A0AAW0UFA0_SCYPA